MKPTMKFLVSLCLLVLMSNVYAEAKPQPLATDSRIKTVAFLANQVYPIHGSTFITTQIVFGQNEQIVDVEGGDAAAWTLSVDKSLPNVLNLKPTVQGSHSNLMVVTVDNTGRRRFYRFALTSSTKQKSVLAQTYAIQFIYPAEEKRALLAKLNLKQLQQHAIINAYQTPANYHWNYSFSGARNIMPLHVFDDGKFTYFELRPNQELPAIFAVNNAKGFESVVNYRRVGNYIVVQQIAPQFTLRAGKYLVASIFNNGLIKTLRH